MRKLLYWLGIITPKTYILKSLITHYTKAIEKVENEEDMFKIKGILWENGVHKGVCHAADNVFRVYIYGAEWIDKYKAPNSSYWYAQPWDQVSKKGVLQALKFRLDILKTILNSKT